MSVLTRIWSRSSSRESSPSRSPKSDKHKADRSKEVETVQDDQPFNPYTEMFMLEHHKNLVKIMVVIDQYSIASASSDGEVVIIDTSDGAVLHVLDGHRLPVTSMCVMQHTSEGAECTVLLTASSDKQIIVWDVGSGTQLHRLTKHTSTPRCMCSMVEASGQEVFCSGGDRLYLWNSQCELVDTADTKTEEDIQQLLPIKGSKLVAVIDKQLHVYAIGQEPEGQPGSDEKAIRLCRKLPPHREAICSVARINDTSFASGSMDGCIKVWSSSTLAAVRDFNSVQEYVGDDKLYPFSVQHMIVLQQRFLVCAVGSGICIYDSIAGALLAERPHAHFSKINHLQMVSEGELVASCGEDGRIRLWGSRAAWSGGGGGQHGLDAPQPGLLERLVGKRPDEMKGLRKPLTLDLLGECMAHTGAVQMIVDCGKEGMASCGADKMVILWKDGTRQKLRRWNMLRDILHGTTVSGIV